MILRPSKPPVPSVLIVDSSQDSREVLRIMLQRKGVKLLETESAQQGLELIRDHHPGVVVLDLEADSADDREIRGQYDTELNLQDSSLIVLGSTRRSETTATNTQFVSKPYHFGPLIRTIEQLLKRSVVAPIDG